jgi:hypothetical protein
MQRRSVSGVTLNANYTWSTCEGLINQGGGPLNLGTGYTYPQSLLNPRSEAESKELFERKIYEAVGAEPAAAPLAAVPPPEEEGDAPEAAAEEQAA